MFIGHFGVGFGAKSTVPKVSLGTLFFAAQFLDLLWPTFILLGIEKVEIDPGMSVVTPLNFVSYPFTHSLLMAIVWGILFGAIYYALRKNKTAAIILGLCVLSHWILDLIVHVPDLPLYPGNSPLLGFGLWNSMFGTIIVEGIIFGVGVYLYSRSTRSQNKKGTYGFWGLIMFLIIIYVMNLFGSPPPSDKAIAWVGQAQWLIVLWGYWVDRNREAKAASIV